MQDSIRVLIADDHPLFRDGMRGLLGSLPDMEVVGEASSGEQAIELARELQPDVILMDIQMPGINGIEATREIVHVSPRIGVVVVTMFEDDDSVFAAMRAGARGYLLKDASGREVGHAVRAVASGEAIFGAGVAQRLISFFGAPSPAVSAGSRRAFPELTEREEEILSLVAQGKINQEIAKELFVSLKTVRNHVSNIFLKLQVADRAQAVIRAREAGLGHEKPSRDSVEPRSDERGSLG
jgi:DNA-binding NarL/FixJ family response regulator